MADYSDKSHSEVSDDKISRKLVIGLEKSKTTLDVTTQINVGPDIFTLKNRYRTDILSHKLRSLRVKL